MIARAVLLEALQALEADPELATRLRVVLGLFPLGGSDELVRLAETGVSPRTLRRAIAAGELSAVKVGRDLCLRRKDLDAWVATKTVKPGERREPRKPDVAKTPAQRAIERARGAGALRVVAGGQG